MAYTPTTWRDGDTITAARLNKLEQGVADQQVGAPGAPGKDGVSPTVSVTDISGGHRVTITDATGSHTFDVLDGQDSTGTDGSGTPGKDGVSPVVTVSGIANGHRVTVVDVNGTQTFDVLDGKDGGTGPQGTPGKDGAAGPAGTDGAPGKDATINGRNTIEVVAGENVTITQLGDVLTISASGGASSGGSGSGGVVSSLPIGTIVIWSGTEVDIPAGWQLCDGTNDTPDLRGRFVLGASGARAPGTTGGEEDHTLTVEEMPAHSHRVRRPADTDTFNRAATSSVAAYIQGMTTESSEVIGGGEPHNNMPPYYVLCYIMKMTADAADGGTNGGGTTAGVSSFNGRAGAVVPAAGDYTAAMVGARADTWMPTATDVGAATMEQVTAAIQAAVLDSWEGSY